MKNVFMCVNYPKYNPAIGISKKIHTQIEAFQKIGYDVTYSAYSDTGIEIFENDKLVDSYRYKSHIPPKLIKLYRYTLLLDACRKYIEKGGKSYDLGFVRWNALTNKFITIMRAMDSRCKKIIMDCHGYHPSYNPHTIKGKYIQVFTNLNSDKMHQYIDLCFLEAKDNAVWGIPAMPIDTGIDVDAYLPHIYKGEINEIHMISVANELSYHGYDRIIRGISEYKGDREVYLHLVGKMSNKTINLVKKLKLEEKVIFHGYQTGESLRQIYEDCNIGVGPLAPHRIGGKQGTGIKTKEYFAIGLPYFFAGQELLVPDDFPFVLKCESNDNPINVELIIKFYDKVKNHMEIQNIMREFAREHFSWPKTFLKAESILFSNVQQ